MKKPIQLKRLILQTLFITSTLFGLASCNNSQKPEDTKEIAEEHNEAKFETNDQESDAGFLVTVAEINLEEIKLGELAQQNSKMSVVKELGKMMEVEHSKTMVDLTALANKKSITIPTSPTDKANDAYEKLSSKKGTDFDKEYCDMMVKGHKDAIEKFEKAAKDASDADIKAWAESTLPALRNHLDHAIACQKKCENM